jgi:hypothetical protein
LDVVVGPPPASAEREVVRGIEVLKRMFEEIVASAEDYRGKPTTSAKRR